MAKHKDSTFQIRIDEDELELARMRAEQQGMSLSKLVRAFLRRFVRDPEEAVEGLELGDERADYTQGRRRG